jgi:hypothetical protein
MASYLLWIVPGNLPEFACSSVSCGLIFRPLAGEAGRHASGAFAWLSGFFDLKSLGEDEDELLPVAEPFLKS